MALAASQVFGHRTGRIALAGPVPNAGDRQEFALMGREKALAASESAQAAGVRLLMMNQQFAALAFKQMLAASASVWSIASSRSAAQSVERQSKLVRDTMVGSAITASKLSGSAARVASSALKPVHKRVVANASRLKRKSR